MNKHEYKFLQAVPVWETGKNHEMNVTLAFCADISNRETDAKICLAASTSFILTVNGRFIAHGPARTAHGYFRVDEYRLGAYLTQPLNRVAVRVVGYNVNAFSYLNQPSFLCAEITARGGVLAATGHDGFTAYRVTERIQKTQRYSFQRPMTESYELSEGSFGYEYPASNDGRDSVPLERVPAGNFIARDVPYGDNEQIAPVAVIGHGTVSANPDPKPYTGQEIQGISPILRGYLPEELTCASQLDWAAMSFSASPSADGTQSPVFPTDMSADTYMDLDWGFNVTGLYEIDVTSSGDGCLFIGFDEILLNGNVNPFRLGTSALIEIKLHKGNYRFVSAEPYVMRYTRIALRGCAVTVRHIGIYHIAFPTSSVNAKFCGDDESLRKIYDAAVETFRSNTVDIYMDCPSRERAGWLCDSFFTSRVERVLSGRSDVERAFLQNFLLPERFDCIPKGMLPMCYPADHDDKTFIPNWAMWYALELNEYRKRTNDTALVNDARQRMYDLVAYFSQFENEYGLLESLKSWVFIEWSKSNELVQDVSFASNMLYAKMLGDLGELYGDTALTEKAEALRNTIRSMSMTESGFFCDNAYRKDGQLVLSGERTESCQYYAFFCDVATPDTYPVLWRTLVNDFGYNRSKTGLYPEIWPANAFIGNYLRLDLLNRYHEADKLIDNIRGYFLYMAEKTGTLWETVADYASCNHGFASHVLYWMDSLGLIEHTSNEQS